MKKCLKIFILIILALIIVILYFVNNNYNNKGRYQEIKDDVNNELERYMYVIAPKCQDGNSMIITHEDLVYNAGMDKEKFLDVDGKSYCKVYVKSKCNDEKWSSNIAISCKNYQDKGYVDWTKSFDDKK